MALGALAGIAFLSSITCPTAADESASSETALETVTIVATGTSNMAAASAGDVSQEQLAAQPLLRPAAVLENVPGLIVTQHSGEGKANQYFLRAFNLDHGTDLATEVDGMPINMPTHAHGQGYTDLNFLIPELVSDLLDELDHAVLSVIAGRYSARQAVGGQIHRHHAECVVEPARPGFPCEE